MGPFLGSLQPASKRSPAREQIRSWWLISGGANLPEGSMKIAKIALKIVLASSAALALTSSATLAQQATTGTGMITVLDRIHGTVAIRQAPSGTVGASNGGVVTEFKVKGVSLDAVHAGDRVTFSATETGGIKTITKIEKQ
ncbi:copper-binding protein [Bradyrhizobium sediminis]|nr:copper-binding protein [Bradyrhizobium sediminis]